MTFRFFHPARAAVNSLAALASLCFGVLLAHAQEAANPVASPTPTPKARFAYVRFWNLLPTTVGRLELSSVTDPPGRSLMSAVPGSYISGYRSMPPARYSWVVSKSSDRQQVLKSFTSVAAGPDVYLTVVARPATDGGTEPIIELVDDSIDPSQPLDNELRIYQCAPDVRTSITANRTAKTDALKYGDTQILKDLPNGMVPISISILTKTVPGAWNTEADFRTVTRASLVVIGDAYGRIRPRVTMDGPTRADIASEASPAPAASPLPSVATPSPTAR